MPRKSSEGKQNLPPLRFRPLDSVDDLQFIAEKVTDGNLSEAIRLSIREKAERLRLEPAA